MKVKERMWKDVLNEIISKYPDHTMLSILGTLRIANDGFCEICLKGSPVNFEIKDGVNSEFLMELIDLFKEGVLKDIAPNVMISIIDSAIINCHLGGRTLH